MKIQPLARMGYFAYTFVDNKFQMVIPGNSKALLAGLEGSPGENTWVACFRCYFWL